MFDLFEVYKSHKPNYLVTVLTSLPEVLQAENYLKTLANKFDESEILVSGYQVVGQDLDLPENVRVITHINHLIEFVEEQNYYAKQKIS